MVYWSTLVLMPLFPCGAQDPKIRMQFVHIFVMELFDQIDFGIKLYIPLGKNRQPSNVTPGRRIGRSLIPFPSFRPIFIS